MDTSEERITMSTMEEEPASKTSKKESTATETPEVKAIYEQLSACCAEVLKGMASEEEVEFRELMQSEHEEIQNVSAIMDETIRSKNMNSFDLFENYLEAIFVGRLDGISRLNAAKKDFLREEKIKFLEKMIEDIQLKLSELPEEELKEFEKKYGDIFEGGHKKMIQSADRIIELAVIMANR